MAIKNKPKKHRIERLLDNAPAGEPDRSRALWLFKEQTGVDATSDPAVFCAMGASKMTTDASGHIDRTMRWVEKLAALLEECPKLDEENTAFRYLDPGHQLISGGLKSMVEGMNRWLSLRATQAFDDSGEGRTPDSGSAAFAFTVVRLWEILGRKPITGPQVALLAVGVGIDNGKGTSRVRRWQRHVRLARKTAQDGGACVDPMTAMLRELVDDFGGTEASLAAALLDPSFMPEIRGGGVQEG